MTDIILIAVLAVIIGSAVAYIVHSKRKGVKCIGCPSATTCAADSDADCNGNCSSCKHNG